MAIGGYEQNPEFWPDVDPSFAFGLFELATWWQMACFGGFEGLFEGFRLRFLRVRRMFVLPTC